MWNHWQAVKVVKRTPADKVRSTILATVTAKETAHDLLRCVV